MGVWAAFMVGMILKNATNAEWRTGHTVQKLVLTHISWWQAWQKLAHQAFHFCHRWVPCMKTSFETIWWTHFSITHLHFDTGRANLGRDQAMNILQWSWQIWIAAPLLKRIHCSPFWGGSKASLWNYFITLYWMVALFQLTCQQIIFGTWDHLRKNHIKVEVHNGALTV